MRLLGINSDLFLQKDFTHKKSAQNVNKQLSFRFFIRQESIKSKQATFIHK